MSNQNVETNLVAREWQMQSICQPKTAADEHRSGTTSPGDTESETSTRPSVHRQQQL